MKYKKGDRVKIRELIESEEDDFDIEYTEMVGKQGVIASVLRDASKWPYSVKIKGRTLLFAEDELELCFQPVILPKELFEI
jgi:hypothetical protein